MADVGSLLTVASVIAGFGVAVLVFRIQREMPLKTKWLPWADCLLIVASVVAFGLVILPIISFAQPPLWIVTLGSAANSFAAVLVMGYPFAILAHYRLIGERKSGPRYNPEPAERRWVIVTATIAVLVFLARMFSIWDRLSI